MNSDEDIIMNEDINHLIIDENLNESQIIEPPLPELLNQEEEKNSIDIKPHSKRPNLRDLSKHDIFKLGLTNNYQDYKSQYLNSTSSSTQEESEEDESSNYSDEIVKQHFVKLQSLLNQNSRNINENQKNEDQPDLFRLPSSSTLREYNISVESLKNESFQKDLKIENYFDLLPDETLLKIWSLLDTPSVGRIAQCCRRFRETAEDIGLWREMCRIGHWDFKLSPNRFPESNDRDYYLNRFLSYRKIERENETKRIRMKKEKRHQKNKQTAALCMKWFFYGRPYEWLAYVCVILVTILSALKLDNKLDISWPVVFIPLYYILYQLITAPLIYDILKTKFHDDFQNELDPSLSSSISKCGPLFFFLTFIIPFQENPKWARMTIYPLAFLSTIWLFLISFNLSKVNDPLIPWWGVFIPLILLCCIFSQIPLWIGSSVMGDENRVDRILPCCAAFVFITFLTFLFLKLDDFIDWSYYTILAPIFIIQGCLACMPCLLSTIWGIDSCFNDPILGTRWGGDNNSLKLCGGFCLFTTFVLGPLLVFEVLLVENIMGDEDRDFSIIFVPLFFLEGLGVCICCVMNFSFGCFE